MGFTGLPIGFMAQKFVYLCGLEQGLAYRRSLIKMFLNE